MVTHRILTQLHVSSFHLIEKRLVCSATMQELRRLKGTFCFSECRVADRYEDTLEPKQFQSSDNDLLLQKMLPGSLVYESTFQARFIAKVSNRGNMLIFPFCLGRTYKSAAVLIVICFVFSHTYFISLGLQTSLWAIGSRFWYVFPMSRIMQLFWLSHKLNRAVFLNGHLIVFKHCMEEETIQRFFFACVVAKQMQILDILMYVCYISLLRQTENQQTDQLNISNPSYLPRRYMIGPYMILSSVEFGCSHVLSEKL